VLKDAAGGDLGPATDEQLWRRRFDEAWSRRVAELEPETDAPAERWPGFNARKVAARRLALGVSREFDAGAQLLPEHLLALGELRGRADLVVRRPDHEIRDYKTGTATDEEGSPRDDYVRQLLIYAFMEAGEAGWPERLVLVPFRGPPLSIELSGRESASEDAAAEATSALHTYNAEHANAADPLSLATPSPSACKYCDHATRCAPFWDSLSIRWAEDGVAAVAGLIREVRVAQNGGIALEIDVTAGSIPGRTVIVTPVDPAEFPGVEALAVGTLIAATGLRPRGEGFAQPGFFTRLEWT
jgi:hypothetical protein